MNHQMIAENLEAEDPIWLFYTEYILFGTGYTPGRMLTLQSLHQNHVDSC